MREVVEALTVFGVSLLVITSMLAVAMGAGVWIFQSLTGVG